MAHLTHNLRQKILQSVPNSLHSALKQPYHWTNYLLASKPRYAIVGTGRCGTKFTARFLDDIGIGCSHEAYFTPDGPVLRSKYRYYKAGTDASWLAAPFLPDEDIRVLHQVRHPVGVISSFYKLGFFDPEHYQRYRRYVDFAKQYFDFSTSPARSCARWYIEWNKRCESTTQYRIQLEQFEDSLDTLANWLQIDQTELTYSRNLDPVNARHPIIDFDQDNLIEQLCKIPEYTELQEVASKYGYDLNL